MALKFIGACVVAVIISLGVSKALELIRKRINTEDKE